MASPCAGSLVPLTIAFLLAPALARGQATVTVDPHEGARPISPWVYGINNATAASLEDANLTLTVWGGRFGTRYNWKTDVANHGRGGFFKNVPSCWVGAQGFCDPVPVDPQANSAANRIIADAAATEAAILVTVPAMGHVPAGPPAYAEPFPCGCPVDGMPPQASVDPTGTCGNGRDAAGAYLACPDPTTTTSIAIDAAWAREWVTYLVARFGPSDGRRIYLVDDEPALWHRTHGDAHPLPTTADELWTKYRDTAEAILEADPTARVGGFSEWAWPNYLCSAADTAVGLCSAGSPERAARGGLPLVEWFLQRARDHERATGRRILHVLDLHYYAPAAAPAPADAVRALWDASYVDPQWNEAIALLPRMRAWVDAHYPGTGIGLSDYAFYAHDTRLGAVAYATALGVLGREGAEVAAATHVVRPGTPPYAAFRLFRDYDGAGGAFEATSVAAVADGGVSAFAAKGDGRVTVALANPGDAREVAVSVERFAPSGDAEVWVLDAQGTGIARADDAAWTDGTATIPLGAASIAMVIAKGTILPPDDPPPPGETAGAESGCGCRSAAADGYALAALLAALAAARRRRA